MARSPRSPESLLASAVLLVALTACAPAVIYQPPEKARELVVGFPEDMPGMGLANHLRLSQEPSYPVPAGCLTWDTCKGYRKPDGKALNSEWGWNKKRGEPPRLCLAMSGGGLRSATFNLGVLKGLHEANILNDVDVVSGVSGGAYILSWYVAQKYHLWLDKRADLKTGDSAIFSSRGRYVDYLRKRSDFYSKVRGVVPVAVAVFPGIPLNLFVNGIFGLHTNTSFLYNSYSERVREVFHETPEGPPQKTSEEIPVVGAKNAVTLLKHEARPGIAITELAKFMRQTQGQREIRPPLFIFNATALIDAGIQQPSGLLQNTVFEFTPFQFGSDAFGRYQYASEQEELFSAAPQRQWDLDEIVTFSGAALDFNKQTVHPSSRQLATALNVDLGRYIRNPRLTGSKEQWAWQLTPLAHIFQRPHYSRDIDGTHIYLSDGGHSENLGAFSLVRRLCEEVIIVDAEEDPGYTFGAYFTLKEALQNEMGVTLRIDAIEELRKSTCANVQCNESLEYPEKGVGWTRVARSPVFEGAIRTLPYCQKGPSERIACRSGTIKVHYLKLAYAPRDSAPECANMSFAGCFEKSMLDVYEATGGCVSKPGDDGLECGTRSHAPFPQLPTVIQEMPHEHWDAYRNLGCKIVLTYLVPHTSHRTLSPEEVATACLR